MDFPHLFPLPSFIVFDRVADLELKLMGITSFNGRKGPVFTVRGQVTAIIGPYVVLDLLIG
jgi:hypothetical protein